jgi:molybdenum cofactor cytidylyltransferase/nicotine blue oxidoreductase
VTYDAPRGGAAPTGARSSPFPGGEGLDVAVAVLAAGRGSRFGGERPKSLAEWHGRPLVSWALEAAVTSGLFPVLLVTGHGRDSVAGAAPAGVDVVHSPHWHRGIAHSLRAALTALDGYDSVGAVCIGLADQPRVGAEAYRRLAAAHADGATLAVATYGGTRGNPVLLARSLWPEAHELDGDVGARVLMQRHPVVEVPCDDTGSPVDVDTPDDLQNLDLTIPDWQEPS